MLSKLQSLVGNKSSNDKHALAEKREIDEAAERNKKARFFVLQALEALKKLERDGGTFICSSPGFECYFKKNYMPLFEEKNAYINVSFDKADNVTHVCGLLPRLQHEKERNKVDDENITLAKMPDCLLSHAIAELSRAPRTNLPGAGNVVYQDQTASTQQRTIKAGNVVRLDQAACMQQQKSKAGGVVHQGQTASAQRQAPNLMFDPYASARSLEGPEKEWLDSMHASLIDSEYETLLHLLQHSVIARGFREATEHFLIMKKELVPGSRSVVIDSFQYLARDFQINEPTISVAQIGSSLERRLNLAPKEIFSTIVELFFCLGYEKEIKGYTTGFVE